VASFLFRFGVVLHTHLTRGRRSLQFPTKVRTGSEVATLVQDPENDDLGIADSVDQMIRIDLKFPN
jgi:hypothetical protein